MKTNVLYLISSVASLSLLMNGSGCSRNGSLEGLVPVHGVITYQGQPIEQGTIGFVPVEESNIRPATATIASGKFTMMTTASSPGVMPGKYRVLVISQNGVPAKTKQAAPRQAADQSTDDLPAPSMESPSAIEVVSLIPRKYSNPLESGLEVEVTARMPQMSFNLE